MKISSRMKPPELVTRTSWPEPAVRLLPTQPVAAATRRLPPDGGRFGTPCGRRLEDLSLGEGS